MSAIPTIWFLLKLLWTHRTHLGNYASYNAGLTCQRTAQGQPGDWPSCDKSALTSSKLIWPGADCWQLIILAIPSSKEVKGRWKRVSGMEESVRGGRGREKKKWVFIFIPHLLAGFYSSTNDELWDVLYLLIYSIFSEYMVQCVIWTGTYFWMFWLCPLDSYWSWLSTLIFYFSTSEEPCRNWSFLWLLQFRQNIDSHTLHLMLMYTSLNKRFNVSTLTSKSLLNFITSVLEHQAKTRKNVSLTALYFHPLYFIVLICFVLLCYSLQQRLHLPNFCNSLGEYSLTNSATTTFDAPKRYIHGKTW